MTVHVAGIDGCKGGWLVACATPDLSVLMVQKYNTFAEILSEPFGAIAIDIPIGLPDSGARTCDVQARKLIGPRRSSVFPCPIRPLFTARDYEEACRIGIAKEGRKLSQQAWAIAPKISEVDLALTPAVQSRVIEVHPELCFYGLNRERALDHPKKEREGLALRRRLLTDAGLEPGGFYDQLPPGAALDDLHDALAALWTALRYHRGEARRVPDTPATDARGLRMEMWY